MALTRDVVIRLLGDADSAVRATKAAADAAEVSVTAYRRAEREQRRQADVAEAAARQQRQHMQTVGETATVLGVAMLAGTAIAVRASAEFDAAMSGVAATSREAAAAQEELRAAALQAGATTAYSATEAAHAQTELLKAGMSVTDVLNGGLAGALALASAGQMSVADAAEIAATQLTVFQLNGQQASHVADLLAAGAGKAQGGVQDLGLALEYAGLPAKGLGLSIEETTGSLALFASNGLIGEKAGTAFRSMLVSMTSPSTAAKTAMDDLGLSFFDASGEFIGMEGVAGQLQTRLGGLTTEQRNATLSTLFGNVALGAAQALYNGGAAGVQKWTTAVNDSGYAAEQAAKLQDNLAGDVEKLGGALSTALIEGGSGANDVLRWLTQAATGAVDAFSSLPGPVEGVGVGLLTVVGSGTLLLGVVGSMIPRIHEARTALVGLGGAGAQADRALGVVGRLGGAAALAAGGLFALSTAFDYFHPPAELVIGDTEKLQAALTELGQSGEVAGALRATFGASLHGLVDDMNSTLPEVTKGLDNWLYTVKVMNEEGHIDLGELFSWDTVFDRDGDLQNMQDQFAQARQNVEDLDGALAGMVNGNAEAAAAATMRLYEAWVKSGGEIGEFRRQFPDTVAALEAYSSTSDSVVSDTGEITNALGEATAASEILDEAFDALNGVALSNAEANIRWTETLAGIKIAAEEGSASLDLNTAAGAANAQQFVDAAGRANEFSQTIADTQGIEAGRAALGGFRDALIEQAVQSGFSREAVVGLVDQLFRVPADTPAAVTLHDNATPGIGAVNQALDTINGKTSTVYVTTVTTEVVNRILNARPVSEANLGSSGLVGLPDVPRRARGGPVWPGQAFWVGEEGPELVRFGARGEVSPADESARIAAAVQGAPTTVTPSGSMVATPMAAYGGSGAIAVTAAAPQVTVLVTLDGREIAAATDVQIDQALGALADIITNAGG